MNALTLNPPKKHFTFLIQNLVSAIFVFFIFCLDEGYNDLRWTHNPGNWIAYLVYIALFSVGQMIAKVYLFKNEYTLFKSIVIGITGAMIDLIIIMFLVLVNHLCS